MAICIYLASSLMGADMTHCLYGEPFEAEPEMAEILAKADFFVANEGGRLQVYKRGTRQPVLVIETKSRGRTLWAKVIKDLTNEIQLPEECLLAYVGTAKSLIPFKVD